MDSATSGFLFGIESERRAIDAIAQASWAWTIWEYMPQMPLTGSAAHLCAHHSMRDVSMLLDHGAIGWRGETRPARSAIKFCV